MKKIYLLTKNPGKLKAANSAFGKFNLGLLPVEKDYPEIQADTSLEVARHMAIEAAQELGAPVIREDHSLFIEELGIPGPFMNYVEKRIPAEKICELIKKIGNNKGYFEVATVLAQPDGQTYEYTFRVPMTFGGEIKGENPKGWNGLIRLEDETRAITEYPEEERLHIWNQGFEAVAKYINSL